MGTANSKKYVVVTTMARGVYFGELVGSPSYEKVTLRGLRNAYRWGVQNGYAQLAVTGPSEAAKVGARVPGRSTLYQVSGVYECTPEAVEAWGRATWAR